MSDIFKIDFINGKPAIRVRYFGKSNQLHDKVVGAIFSDPKKVKVIRSGGTLTTGSTKREDYYDDFIITIL